LGLMFSMTAMPVFLATFVKILQFYLNFLLNSA
jgi:hypothetical protein